MKPSDMDDAEPELTEADRRAIAEIRRKLDAELRQKLDAEFGVQESAAVGGSPPIRSAHAPATRRRARQLVGMLLIGILTGTVVGITGTFLWGRSAGRQSVLSDRRGAAQQAEATRDVETTPWVAVDDVALLRDTLDDWIEATRRGDIPTQMRFYPPQVPVYYTWRNVSREAVRAEKVKVFGAASRLIITTGAPAIELDEDGQTATTRFRKRYLIEGPVIRRRGEVLQELRWTRTSDGWVIVGERDARVLRSS